MLFVSGTGQWWHTTASHSSRWGNGQLTALWTLLLLYLLPGWSRFLNVNIGGNTKANVKGLNTTCNPGCMDILCAGVGYTGRPLCLHHFPPAVLHHCAAHWDLWAGRELCLPAGAQRAPALPDQRGHRHSHKNSNCLVFFCQLWSRGRGQHWEAQEELLLSGH